MVFVGYLILKTSINTTRKIIVRFDFIQKDIILIFFSFLFLTSAFYKYYISTKYQSNYLFSLFAVVDC